MLKRLVLLPTFAFAGACVVASLGGASAHGAASYCVDVNGTPRAQNGTAACSSGPHSTGVAVGPGTTATMTSSTNSHSTAVNGGSTSEILASDHVTSTQVEGGTGVTNGSDHVSFVNTPKCGVIVARHAPPVSSCP